MDSFIPAEEVKYIFSAADAVILPYREATQSGILQIAFNFHKPVIASDCGGLAELITNGETGIIVKENTPEKLAEAINLFYEKNYQEKFTENIKSENEKDKKYSRKADYIYCNASFYYFYSNWHNTI